MKTFSYISTIISELDVDEGAFKNAFGLNFLKNFDKFMKSTNSGWNRNNNNKTMESFWSYLSNLENGINTFKEPFTIIDFLCSAGPPQSFTSGRISVFEQYFMQYHGIPEEIFNSGEELFNYDLSVIEKSICIFVNIEDDSVFNELCNFLIYVAQQSADQFTEIIPFYVQTIMQILSCPNTLTILRFLLKFIDGIEGRINVSKYGHEIFKYPKRMRNLRIIAEDGTIDIQIDPEKISPYSIKNVISTIKEIPFDSFLFDIDESSNTIKLLDTGNSNMEPSVFEAYPSYILSKDEDFVQHVFRNLGKAELAPILLKILHRMKLPGYKKEPSFYNQSLSNQNVSPYHYQYVTEFILYHFIGIQNQELQFKLQKEMNESEYRKFNVIVGILLQNLIESRFNVLHQISAIEIVRLFHKSVFFDPEQFFILLGQFITFPKCENILFLLAHFLIDNQDSEELNYKIIDKKLLKDLILKINYSNYKAMKIVISNLDGIESFNFLAFNILISPNDYTNISFFIRKISKIVFKKYPEIANEIISAPFEQLTSKPCQIICDELIEAFKVQNFDAFDLISCFFEASNKNRDLPLKRSICHFLREIPETENMIIADIFSIIDQEFDLSFFDIDNFEIPSQNFNGLSNTGNTCYINSILQQLNSIDQLFELFVSSHDELRPDIECLKFLFFEMRYKSDDTEIDSSTYCQLYQESCPEFDVHEQQDADEYMRQLFDYLPREVVKLFKGKQTNIVINNSMRGEVETTEEVFLTIPLNLKESSDLQSSLHSFLEQHTVEDEGIIHSFIQTKLTKLPQILIFHLHRFEFSKDFQEKIKINSYFAFPTALNMDEFFTHQGLNVDGNDDDEKEEEEFMGFGIYSLRGVVIHAGNAIGGHYMSIIKCDFDKANIEGESGQHWLLFNDGIVTGISEEELFQMSFGDLDEENPNSSNAYILFYEKVGSEGDE